MLAGFAAFSIGALSQFRSETRLVVLHASVVDHKGNHVQNLGKDAFTVYENGQPQNLKLFRHEDVPVSLGIVIDDSASMMTKRSRVEAAALEMVRNSNPEDEVFVVNFNDDAYLDVPFTNDPHKLEQGLARIDSRGGTAMRDAISMSLDYMGKNAKKDKKVLVVITDGTDNASNITLKKLVAKDSTSATIVYAIGLFSANEKGEAHKAKRALNELTGATGGAALYPKEVLEVQSRAIQIAHDIRSQYTLAYTPALQELDGSYRRIRVVVNAPGKPAVRTRSGYYARPNMEVNKETASARSQQEVGDRTGIR